MRADLDDRAAVHAALGDPARLAIVDELSATDRSPTELGHRLGLPGNLLAHHLDVLARVGLIERVVSSGDRRRRYVRLRRDPLLSLPVASPLPHDVVFVCTQNSARSQLAAALWRSVTGGRSSSAGTHPADAVHPGAIAAAQRAGLRLGRSRPRHVEQPDRSRHVVTVCDRAHEELEVGDTWWHWSVADPVEAGTDAAFDRALRDLRTRIESLTEEREA